ncbi:TetR/AcrR family transcriptional regulator [Nocardia tengchongensis]|uniref:TetR/AcrR family transcriptional regulator n=1 Tax=Nocardia tengchongensis TaxID=2055889 RepID=UPI00369088BF
MGTRTGRPPRLSRAQILATAHRIIETHGMEALTMRRLATELGATPMAVYHHVRDKDQLLLLLLDEAASALARPDLSGTPRERLMAASLALRDTLARVPWIIEVLTADDLFAPAAMWYPEAVIDAAMAGGLALDDAVRAYRTIWYYTAGEIMVHASAARRRNSNARTTFRDDFFAHIDAGVMPRLAAVADRWADLTEADTYESGLRALIDGLLATTDPPAPDRAA